MKIKTTPILSFLLTAFVTAAGLPAIAQVGIGTTSPNISAVLDLTSSSQGLLVPRMTNAQITAISSPATGLLVFQTDGTSGFYYYTGSAWLALSTQSVSLPLSVANGGTGASTLTSGNILFGNGATGLATNNNLHWDNTNDRLGIGTATPICPLQITSTASYNLGGSYGDLYDGSILGTTSYNSSSSAATYSVYAAGRMAATEFDAYSDARIKENIHPVSADSAAAVLEQLRPVTFQYIDKPAKGSRIKYGLIAQELEKQVPSAVTKTADFIPNIFREVTDGSSSIICAIPGIKAGDEIKLITTEGEKIVKISSVSPVSAGFSFPSEYRVISLDWANPDKHYFVYGTKVNDLRTVDYDQLIVLCIGALQDLDRRLQDNTLSLADQFRKMTRRERRQLRKMLK